MSNIDLLESVLAKDETLVAGVRPIQLDAPTRCPDYDVRALLNHLVGWLQVFAASANGRTFEGDAASYTTDDPLTAFRSAAAEAVGGWRGGGVERTVRMVGGEVPGQLALAMSLVEYVAHGCDLAAATGQAVPFTEAELDVALERAQSTLPDAYRGEGKPFGEKVPVPDDAPVLDRFLGFIGRRV